MLALPGELCRADQLVYPAQNKLTTRGGGVIADNKKLMQLVCLAALMLLPGAAWACEPVGALGGLWETLGSFVDTVHLLTLAVATVAVTAGIFMASPIVWALEWAAATSWKAATKTQPAFGFWSVFALVLAVMLIIFGLFGIPVFGKLFASYGADLPMPTRLLVSGRYLLVLPLVVTGGLLYRWRFKSRRERYSLYVLAGEALLSILVLWALYFPIFRMC